MSTRSLTVIRSNEFGREQEICVLYGQFDGYIAGGHGQELGEFLSDFTIGNGAGGSRSLENKYANGASCLAAQIIARFKTEIGNYYLYPAGTRDVGEEYIYLVTAGHGLPIEIEVHDPSSVSTNKVIFSGTPEQLATHKE